MAYPSQVMVANTAMDTDKIKIYGARVKVDSLSKVAAIEQAEKEEITNAAGRRTASSHVKHAYVAAGRAPQAKAKAAPGRGGMPYGSPGGGGGGPSSCTTSSMRCQSVWPSRQMRSDGESWPAWSCSRISSSVKVRLEVAPELCVQYLMSPAWTWGMGCATTFFTDFTNG